MQPLALSREPAVCLPGSPWDRLPRTAAASDVPVVELEASLFYPQSRCTRISDRSASFGDSCPAKPSPAVLNGSQA
jgi:hypothetical protein